MSSVSDEPDGLLDTNVFVHAQTNDDLSEECARFLTALQLGRVRARLEPMVLHELSYARPHYRKPMTREQIGEYMLAVLSWPGVQGEKELMIDAVNRWLAKPGLSFVDAYLSALASQEGRSIHSKNVHHLTDQGVDVPNPLPSGQSAT